MAAFTTVASTASAQTARDIRGPSPLVAIESEPPAKLIVDPPLPEQLAQGLLFIQYRTENLRVVPVFGKGAFLRVLPTSKSSALDRGRLGPHGRPENANVIGSER